MGKPLNQSIPEDSTEAPPLHELPHDDDDREHGDGEYDHEHIHHHHVPSADEQAKMNTFESRSHLTKFYSR